MFGLWNASHARSVVKKTGAQMGRAVKVPIEAIEELSATGYRPVIGEGR